MYYDFGINDRKYSTYSREYRGWMDMMRRCYDTAQAENPRYTSYAECSVDPLWKVSSKFGDWANIQKGFGLPGYVLDKDILVPGNKVYGPDACCFVPNEINMALTLRAAARGDLPLGVYKGKMARKGQIYVAKVLRGSLSRLQVGFYTVEEAHNYYIENKKIHLSYLADKYKDQIDERVFLRLNNFEF